MSDYSLDLPTYEELLQRGLSALPEGTDVGSRLLFEDLQWTLLA